jgi:hypothetical protein
MITKLQVFSLKSANQDMKLPSMIGWSGTALPLTPSRSVECFLATSLRSTELVSLRLVTLFLAVLDFVIMLQTLRDVPIRSRTIHFRPSILECVRTFETSCHCYRRELWIDTNVWVRKDINIRECRFAKYLLPSICHSYKQNKHSPWILVCGRWN